MVELDSAVVTTVDVCAPRVHPLSAAQLRWWVARELDPSVPATVALCLDFDGPLEVEVLREGAARAAAALESPLVRLRLVDGVPHQYIDPRARLDIELIDLSGYPDAVARAEAAVAEDHDTALDPLDPALTVAVLYRLSDARHLLYLRSHHLVLDGLGAAALLWRTARWYDTATARAPFDPVLTNGRQGSDPAAARVGGNGRDRVRPLSIADLLEEERRYRASARVAADRAYWAAQVADLPEPVGLAGGTAPAAARPLRVGATVRVGAETLARSHRRYGARFPELLVAAFACYLARMTGREEVALALPVPVRPTAALRASAGSVSNVVPLRIALAPDDTVARVVARVRHAVIGALRHQRYPYEDMLRDRDGDTVTRGGFGPVLNVLGLGEPPRLGPLRVAARLLALGPVEDLLVNGYRLGADSDEVTIDFQANPARYEPAAVRDLHDGFCSYFRAFVDATPDAPVPEVDRARSREDAIPAAAPGSELLADLLRRSVGPHGDRIALVDGARVLTYRELDERADRLSRVLSEAGAGPGVPVLTLVSRSHRSVLAWWAVARCGAYPVPVDPADPASRRDTVCAGSGARIGLRDSESELATETVVGQRIDWISLDDPGSASSVDPVGIEPIRRPADRAYVIHTSGTTGAPRGVAVTNAGLAALAGHLRAAYRVRPESVVLHAHSPCFDAHLLELLAAFTAGARLVVAPAVVPVGRELADLIGEYGVTHFLTTPAVLATLDPGSVPSLATVVVGGEACPPELVRRWGARVRLHNGYGPTETTVMTFQSAPLRPGAPVTIGPPLPGVRALVLDARLRPAAPAAIAELYLGGPCVAEGYHGDPGTTAVRFVADPQGTGERVYRTGDLVRRAVVVGSPGGWEWHGRVDGQLSLRGRRIEPAEVEAALMAGPEIEHAAVAVFPAGQQGIPADRLVGYVVPARGFDFDAAATLRRVRTLLPAPVVPSTLAPIERIPTTGNGKVDRSALPVPTREAVRYRAPETTDQHTVAAAMARASGRTPVGLDDDFFALGGTSLSGVAFAADLARETGAPVTVRWLYTAPTVAALADRITAHHALPQGAASGEFGALDPILTLRAAGSGAPLFCVHSAVPLAWCYAGLARKVGDRPVYGVQASGLSEGSRAGMLDGADLPELDLLAAEYAERIRGIAGGGPCHLLGWSLGGQLAHAIGRRLRELGVTVGVLAMLDSVVFPPGSPAPAIPRMRDLLTHLLGEEPEDADDLPDLDAEQAAHALAVAGTALGAGLSARQLSRLHRAYVAGVRLSHGHRPGLFDGDLLYFSATRGVTAPVDERLWRPYVTGALTCHPVEATHAQLTNAAAVAVIGPVLARHLARVEDDLR